MQNLRHKEVLTKEQLELLPLVGLFKKNFGLVGGTAMALQIGHRESIDFDMFSLKKFENKKIIRKVRNIKKIDRIARSEEGQITFSVGAVQFTFFHYPFHIKFERKFDNFIKMPNLLTLAAMKAYALGHRAKWKDYVDLYFIMNGFHSVDEISKKAKTIFNGEFNERIFREQLSYFKDINYSEEIIFKKGFEVGKKIIKKELVKFSLV